MDLDRCQQFALSSLDKARLYYDDETMRYTVPDEVRSACMWAIEYWLRMHDHQPDVGNGWHSMLLQFIELVPRDDPAYDLSIAAQLAGTANGYCLGWPDEGPSPRKDALPQLLLRAEMAIKAVTGE